MAILENVVRIHEGLPPWFVQRAAELAGAAGRVSVAGQGFGTGFLVAPQLILSCYHVLPDATTAEASSIEFDYQRDEDGTFGQVTAVRLHPQRCFLADQALDFCLVGLETELKNRPVIPLTVDGDATLGEWVSLFHHPQAGPLQLSLRGGAVIAVYDDVLHHSVNTQGGSAGAPLLDETLRLIGLHHASVPRNSERVRTTRSPGVGMFVANEAVRVTAILAALREREPSLFAQMNVVGGPESVRPFLRASSVQSTPPAAAAPEIVDVRASAVRDSVFISYARADQGKRRWRERLRTFLVPFGEELDVWDDSRIETGAQWRTEIDIALRRARVAVLLVGPSFLGSGFITKNELPPLLKAAAAEKVVVLPLITNHCSYERTELGKYQAFNDPKKPLEAMELPEQNHWLQRFAEKVDEAFRQWGKG